VLISKGWIRPIALRGSSGSGVGIPSPRKVWVTGPRAGDAARGFFL